MDQALLKYELFSLISAPVKEVDPVIKPISQMEDLSLLPEDCFSMYFQNVL